MNTESSTISSPVVDAAWLENSLDDENLRVLDASWHLPSAKRDARAEYIQAHIPGAVFFDIDEHSAPDNLPHMLPDKAQFDRITASLNLALHHTIVVYDMLGLFSAARVWWMFRHFGARQVYVLDGGLPAWRRNGGKLVSIDNESAVKSASQEGSTVSKQANTFIQPALKEVVDVASMKNAMSDKNSMILDARSHSRFTGAEKEARAGLLSGHIPGSHNLPFQQVLNQQGMLLSVSQLQQVFADKGVQADTRVVTTCGSGVTAAVLCLALAAIGHDDVALYDGSWAEWGSVAGLPVATGA